MAHSLSIQNGDVVTRVMTNGETTFLQDMQDCDELIAKCAEERAQDVLRGHRKVEPFRCVMEVPVVLVEALKAQGLDIINDRDALKRVANDPAFAAFRTSAGRV